MLDHVQGIVRRLLDAHSFHLAHDSLYDNLVVDRLHKESRMLSMTTLLKNNRIARHGIWQAYFVPLSAHATQNAATLNAREHCAVRTYVLRGTFWHRLDWCFA